MKDKIELATIEEIGKRLVLVNKLNLKGTPHVPNPKQKKGVTIIRGHSSDLVHLLDNEYPIKKK